MLSRYELRQLAAHLELAGRAADLDRLLWAEAPSGENLWLSTREADGDVDGYLDDVARAIRLAAQPKAAGAEASTDATVRHARAQLLRASVESLGRGVPPALLEELVRQGLWPPGLALTYALRAHLDVIGESIAAVVPYLSPDLALLALDGVMRMTSDHHRGICLWALWPALPPSAQDDLLAGLDLTDRRGRQTLGTVAGLLSEAQARATLRRVDALPSGPDRMGVQLRLAGSLPEPELSATLDDVERSIRGVESQYTREGLDDSLAYAAVARGQLRGPVLDLLRSGRLTLPDVSVLSPEQRDTVAAAVRTFDPGVRRLTLLASLGALAAPDDLAAEYDRARNAVTTGEARRRAGDLVELLPFTPPDARGDLVLQILRDDRAAGGGLSGPPDGRAAACIRELPRALVGPALRTVRGLPYLTDRVPLLGAIAGRATPRSRATILEGALAEAMSENYAPQRAKALEHLMPFLGEADQLEAARAVIAATRPQERGPRELALVTVARLGHARDALSEARRIGDDYAFVQFAVEHLPRMSADARSTVVQPVVEVVVGSQSGLTEEPVVRLAPYLSGDQVVTVLTSSAVSILPLGALEALFGQAGATGRAGAVLDLAVSRPVKDHRAVCLAALATYLDDRTVAVDALSSVYELDGAEPVVRALTRRGTTLLDDVLPDALTAARTSRDSAVALAVLAGTRPEPADRDALIAEAFEIMRDDPGNGYLASVATELVGMGLLPWALKEVLDWPENNAETVAYAVEALLPELSAAQRPEAVAKLRRVAGWVSSEFDSERFQTLARRYDGADPDTGPDSPRRHEAFRGIGPVVGDEPVVDSVVAAVLTVRRWLP